MSPSNREGRGCASAVEAMAVAGKVAEAMCIQQPAGEAEAAKKEGVKVKMVACARGKMCREFNYQTGAV